MTSVPGTYLLPLEVALLRNYDDYTTHKKLPLDFISYYWPQSLIGLETWSHKNLDLAY